MLLYVNGDSHSSGAETHKCVDGNFVSFKGDDSRYWRILGTEEAREAHPECIDKSYGQHLANLMGADFMCDAVPGSSNSRIIRTTWDRFSVIEPEFAVFGWSTWERKEYFDTETKRYWQVNAGGPGQDWPQWLRDIYPKYVTEINWQHCVESDHTKLFLFHKELQRRDIPHLFFNTYSHLEIPKDDQWDWDNCYLDPYSPNGTYYNWCIQNGFKTVSKNSYHFGEDAHRAWAGYLYNQISHNCLTRK